MSRLVFEVGGGNAEWIADGVPFAAGEHVFEDAPPELIRLASTAHDAKVGVTVSEGLDESAYQSQEDGEAALKEAMGEHHVVTLPDGTSRSYWTGPWFLGNVEQHELEKQLAAEREAAGEESMVIDVGAVQSISSVLGDG